MPVLPHGQDQVRRDLPEGRRDPSRPGAHRAAGGAGAARVPPRGHEPGLRRPRPVLPAAAAGSRGQPGSLRRRRQRARDARRRARAVPRRTSAADRPRPWRPTASGRGRRRLAQRPFLAGGRRVLHRRAAAVVHALRAADAADPVVADRRPGRRRVAAARAGSGRELFAGHGAGLHRASASPPDWSARGWLRRCRRPGCWGPLPSGLLVLAASMFGFYELQLPQRAARPCPPGKPQAAGRARGRRVRDGRHLGVAGQPLRRGAAGRRARLSEPDARRRCSVARPCSRWPAA